MKGTNHRCSNCGKSTDGEENWFRKSYYQSNRLGKGMCVAWFYLCEDCWDKDLEADEKHFKRVNL